MINRRSFLSGLAGGAMASTALHQHVLAAAAGSPPAIDAPLPGEDVFSFIQRHRGRHDPVLYAQILGAANEFKEGDQIIGVAAANSSSRNNARSLLSHTKLRDINAHSLHRDRLFHFIAPATSDFIAPATSDLSGNLTADSTLGQLGEFLLRADEVEIKKIMPALSSDVIACVVKLLTNNELISIGAKVFNPLPGSQIGAKGYLGARIQPNSPTDNVDDILFQVLDGWSYAVGDVLLGTNPVSSDPDSVAAIERTLQDLLVTFQINDQMPHCVLAHIDVQAEVEKKHPGSTELWFQSIAGCDDANETFDVSVEELQHYARQRSGRFGLYFETGQGADFTNGHGNGFDMVIHESRKYGLARALTRQVGLAQVAAGAEAKPWVHLNDVAGFIGPEVFRTRQQLVRCCLEDIVMGKLHGLCIGLDVCSTLHMDVTLDDLDWCLEKVAPACPAYLMALPTKIDPMLGYLTTGYQDHVRLRNKFSRRVNDGMWQFFQRLQVIDSEGNPTAHFGDPLWVYLQYRRRKGDGRDDQAIRAEGERRIQEVRGRGVFIADGHGREPWDLRPSLQSDIARIYDDAKLSLWAELDDAFLTTIPNHHKLATQSSDREDYILHPASGEQLDDRSIAGLQRLRREHAGQFDVQIVISDGLNALAIMEDGHLTPFLAQLREALRDSGFEVSPEHLTVISGRVRAGYRIGEILYANLPRSRAIIHLIGERPGTGHRTFSSYITAADRDVWGQPGRADHNITKLISGIATTALVPSKAATQVARLVNTMMS